MKPNQNVSTTLVVLQVCMVLLLGVTAILSYQNQAEVQGLRADLVKIRESWGSVDQQTLSERMAALEVKAGLRDPKAAQASKALNAQMAEANALKERFDKLRAGESATPSGSTASALFPRPNPSASATSTPTTPPPAPSAAAPAIDGLTPAEQAIAALPVVAEITEHEPDWGFYMINRGQLDGIRASHEYGVRKKDGYTIVATLKIDRLHPQDAVAELVPDTQKKGAPAPEMGDFLVDLSKLK